MKSILAMLLFPALLMAQRYEPNWESLDKRPIPNWFQDAKFGIFIHWGVYSVPGWSTRGSYAEWYQQGLQTTDSARKKFHQTKFGDKTYYQLADDFKAERYDPDAWARLFERSGAKYIVLTSKHHDGYTLWPSKDANRTWGFPWNSVEVGPKRDLLGDLFKAVRKTSVHAGMYYSLYEWFNPLWKKDHAQFAKEHTWPQMMDLINTYQPDVFWTDGDWDASAETWKSPEFLTWLYNESPVKDKIVVNDRWGSGIRFKHAGIFTPEYQPDLDFEDHYWEESRGMGYSYGYNLEEDAWDYNSAQSMVIALIDKVSRGGNFLLDIGPDEHGKIPPIMQERLLQIGDWMKINGEAIYGTSRWKNPFQWSEGRKDYKGNAHGLATEYENKHDLMLKLTVNPDPGYAVKELFFTYNAAANNLYAIFPSYPSNRKLVLKNTSLTAGTKVELLANHKSLTWKQEGANVVVNLPEYNQSFAKAPYAYAIKINNFGKFAHKPKIEVNYPQGKLQPIVAMKSMAGMDIRYTLDGTEPTETSALYTQPFVLDKTAEIKAIALMTGGLASGVSSQKTVSYQWISAAKSSGKLSPGVSYKAYELYPKVLADLNGQQPVKSGVAEAPGLAPLTRKENCGLVFEGYIKIEKDAIYNFYLASDDGSRLELNDEVLIDHDGMHGNDEKQARAALKKGYHKIRVSFIQATGGIDLTVKYSAEGLEKQSLPANKLFH